MGAMRKAIEDYRMIENGDKIAVGFSGGKDSVALLVSLARSRCFLAGGGFEGVAIMIDMGFDPDAELKRLYGTPESK